MTTEEKLQHFYDVSIESVKTESHQEIKEYKKSLADLFEEHKREKDRQCELELKTETESVKRQINKSLSIEQLNIKRRMAEKQMDLKDKLFEEVKVRLEEFMNSPEYPQYLISKIKEAAEFADHDELTILLSSNDSKLLPELAAQTKQNISVSDELFWGGLKAIIPSKNIIIDNTFSALFNAEKAEFTFDGGLSHE